MIEVVSAVILRRDQREPRILLTQRRGDQAFPFAWESPGGKVNQGENRVDALERELREELGIEDVALAASPLWEGVVTTPMTVIRISFWRVDGYRPTPTPREGQGIGWWTAEEMVGLTLLPGNQAARAAILAAMHGGTR